MLVPILLSAAMAADWPRIFGPDGDSHADLPGLPTEWSAEDYEWSATLPGVGHSSPVVHGTDVFVTCGTGDGTRSLVCLDVTSGEQRWTADVKLDPSHLHKKNSYGSSSPAVDEDRIVCVFADTRKHLVVSFGRDGGERWRTDLGGFESQHGQGSSPVLDGGRVYVANDQLGASSVLALDAATGETVWRTPRESGHTAYATPRLVDLCGRRVLLTAGTAEGVAAFDPEDGRRLFASGPVPLRVVASPVVVPGDGVVITCGSGGIGKHMECVDVRRDREEWSAANRWTLKKQIPYVPTPVVAGGALFFWNDRGTLARVDPADGSMDWVERLGGNFSGSPLVVGERMVAVDEDGKVLVVDAGETFKRHPGGSIPDNSYATPSVGAGRLLIRGFGSLHSLKP